MNALSVVWHSYDAIFWTDLLDQYLDAVESIYTDDQIDGLIQLEKACLIGTSYDSDYEKYMTLCNSNNVWIHLLHNKGYSIDSYYLQKDGVTTSTTKAVSPLIPEGTSDREKEEMLVAMDITKLDAVVLGCMHYSHFELFTEYLVFQFSLALYNELLSQ